MNNKIIALFLVIFVLGGVGYFAINSSNTNLSTSTSMEEKKI